MSVVTACAPTFSIAPDASQNHWREVSDLCRAYDLVLDPWQDEVLEAALGERADGTWAASRVGIAVPRQAGKTALFEARELAGLLLYEEKLMIHSAHLVSTALEAFNRIKYYFENFDDLRRRVKRVREGNGDWAVEMMNGSRLLFKARARGSGRGFSADLLMLDEAQILGEREWAAMLPTMSARPNPQAWLAGTPPGPVDDGAAFTKLREAAKVGLDKRLTWVEWSIADRKADVSDRALWWRANPGMEYGRPALESVEDEFHSMDADTFARERLGRWDAGASGSQVFRRTQWDVLKGECPDDVVASFGVKFTSDGSGVALGAAYRHESGVHVEPIRQANMGEGTQWLVDELVARADGAAQIVIDGKSGAGFLVNALRDAGVKNKRMVLLPSLDQYVTAHQMFEQAVFEGSLSHSGKSAFDEQVLSVQRRKIGSSGGFGWSAPLGETVVSVDAVTLAFWGARVSKRKPGKRLRVSA